VGMAEALADLPLRRALQPGEARLELRRLDPVQELEADDPPQLTVACPPDLGHAALADAADQLEALVDVNDLALAFRLGGEKAFESGEKSGHGNRPAYMTVHDSAAP